MRRDTVRVAVAALLLTTGCGATGDGDPSPPTGADQLVLRLVELPGMLPPGGTAIVTPTFSLFGDGRLISVPASRGAVWPELTEHRIPPSTVRNLLAEATALPAEADPDGPDAPVVRVTAVSNRDRRTVTLPRIDGQIAKLRAALVGAATGADTPYRPQAVAAVATPAATAGPAQPWPLPKLGGDPLGGTAAGSRCVVLRDPELAPVRQAASTATAATHWRSADGTWQVAFRPLLPDESACPSG